MLISDMALGIFTLAIQLCEPVGGTIHIGLFNLSACAARYHTPLDSLATLMLMKYSNLVLRSLRLKVAA